MPKYPTFIQSSQVISQNSQFLIQIFQETSQNIQLFTPKKLKFQLHNQNRHRLSRNGIFEPSLF